MTMLSVIIISYRRADDLPRVLDDLVRQAAAPPFEVVLVLQGYAAEVVERIRREFSDRLCLRIHATDQRLGVYGARNIGTTVARGDILAFLDDDVRVPPTWGAAIPAAYRDSTVGGVGGYVHHPGWGDGPRRHFYTVFRLNPTRYTIDSAGFHLFPLFPQPTITQDADWLSGCSMSFRRDVLDNAGGFTDIYGPYGFDDVDLSVRVRRLGYRLMTTPAMSVVHNLSPGGRDGVVDRAYLEERHRVVFARRAVPKFSRTRYVVRFAGHLAHVIAVAIIQRQWRVPFAAICGMVDGLRITARTP